MVNGTLTPRQRQTANGRRAFLERFPDPEAKSAHFRALAERANASRLTLSADEAAALSEALALLLRMAARHPRLTEALPNQSADQATEPAADEAA